MARLITRSRHVLLRGVRRRALRVGLQAADVEDFFQETALRAMTAAKTLRATTETGFQAWFLGIARNLLLETARRKRSLIRQESRKVTTLIEVADPGDPADESGNETDHELGLFWRLRAEHRSVIVLRNLLDLDWDDVAAVLGRPTGSAARILHLRARRVLQERLARIEPLQS